MRSHKRFMLVLLAAVACIAIAQTAPPSPAPALHILTPKSGDKINTNFVAVSYELASPVSAASTPTFQLRLDNQDPVQTTDTQHTFTGIAPGTHTVSVQVVDANNTPLPGVQSQVQFTVLPPGNPPAPASPRSSAPAARAQFRNAALSWQHAGPRTAPAQTQGKPGDEHLPHTGSPLPLLSVIGMGVLLGGIASALRTRHNSSRSR